ncbi:CGNR zinc finger domain-containing protein [Mycolicibacterium mageritense]|uniref:CGNR zinc finger domain-containing protein n=1 Tax=Mycolicibacterium mageritense TaxID=53462 RepID=UPI0011D39FAF|nr:CGNR zinc finger domain-containing protein [Mycolicibacterium mageritense]TXI60877.1 MAG: CGNR zinc finger domain-containing protein [Mycolicibacterium mageritense]
MELVEVGLRDEALLLDLLNTTPVMDGVQHDLLAEGAARAWLREHGAAEGELPDLVAARNVLQAVVRESESADKLDPFLKAVALRPTATVDGLSWELDTDDAMRGAVRAVLAWDALRISGPGRLRACANPDCRLFLIDRSKPNTARWCSMAICGNRMKARRHYQRAKATE